MTDWKKELGELLVLLASPQRTSHVTYNTAYDTAWIARLGEFDRQMSYDALDWICNNQLADGSWGAGAPLYYHDRVISTLAAMTALAQRGRRTQDIRQIEHGQRALQQIASGATRGLSADPNGSTVGFEMVMPTLLSEAEKLRIVNNQDNRILGRISREREKKVAVLKGIKINRFITAAFSAEMAGPEGQQLLDTNQLQEPNGSVAHSPSATAYFALYIKPGDSAALAYLKSIVRDGGVPSTAPFDIFERSWVMWNVALLNKIDDHLMQLSKPHVDALQSAWRPGRGVSYASVHILPDSDDTALTFEILRKFGREVDVGAVLGYEEEDHFRCYSLETTPSTSANVHIIGALRQAGYEVTHPTIQKLLTFLKKSKKKHSLWIDKWHTSPYYTSSHAVIACTGYDDEFVENEIKWILSSQNKDGSWGYHLATAEETAYCIQALSIWRRQGGAVPAQALQRGVSWLSEHTEPPYPPLWIGKCLYCPEYVVRSTILSALILATE